MALRIKELTFIKHQKRCVSHYKYYISAFDPYKAIYVFSDPVVRWQPVKITWVQVSISKKGQAKLTNVPGIWKHKPNQVAGSPDLLATTPSLFLY